LKDDLAILKENQQATVFFNWALSREIFLHAEYFENVVRVSEAFEQDAPEIVVDPDNLLYPFLERIPRLKNQYKREGENYFLINN
jgi:hypothetical protein